MNESLLAICLMVVLLAFYCLYGQICHKKNNKIIPLNNININLSNIDNRNKENELNKENKENDLNNINIYNV
jgi:hypothetical protein